MPGPIQPPVSTPGPAANRNELWARVLLDELARSGVRDLVLSPGSRSTPLVLAAAKDGRFRIRVQIDERSAGFLALGMGKATAIPAAVITTSGTAVANLLPAVVEAHQSETPLLVLTADRPPRLRGADANQTIEQHGIFGSHLHLFVELAPFDVSEASLRHLRATAARAVSVAVGSPGGVVHLNLPFDTPLEPAPVAGDLPESIARGETPGSGGRPGGAPWTVCLPRRSPPAQDALLRTMEALASSRRPLLVAGIVPRPWEIGPILRAVAAELGAPLLADPLSGGRFSGGRAREEGTSSGTVGGADGRGVDRSPAADATGQGLTVGSYDILLREPRLRESLRPDLVLRFGAAPVSSLLTEWLASLEEVPHILVDEGGRWKDHTGSVTLSIPADPGEFLQSILASGGEAEVGRLSAEPDPDWIPAWRHAESSVARSLVEIMAPSSPHTSLFEGMIAAEVAREIPEGEILFVSNSMPVRDLDTFVPSRDASLTVLGNRGASGIDGIVSTAVGASLAAGKRVTALVGDLALLHDANGLASLRESDARVVLVVVNNDGGGIFQFLPIRNYEPAFTPLFATPQGRELRHLADLHGVPHRAIDLRSSAAAAGRGSIGELRGVLQNAFAGEGCQIVEVLTDRRENREVRSRLVHEVAAEAGRLPAVTG